MYAVPGRTSSRTAGVPMRDTSSRWQSEITVIIPYQSEPRVLLLAEEGHWQLPRVPIDDIWSLDIGQISYAVREALGITTSVLRSAWEQADEAQRRASMIYVLENRDSLWQLPAHGRWAGRADLTDLALPEQRTAIDAYLTEVEQAAIPALRTQWCRVGWLDQAVAWIAEQLAALGRPLIAPVAQVKNWSISCILRAPTTDGDTYFKVAASLPLFVNEAVVTAWLAQRYPGHIPNPLALDPTRHWILLPDFGQVIGRSGSLPARIEMLQLLGSIQHDCVVLLDELLALPCHDRRLMRLADQAAALAGDSVALADLNDAERVEFSAAQPHLRAMCGALADCGVPQTLVHGDLHLGNVALQEGRFHFFDWTDACITHPFFDLISVYDEEDTVVQTQLRDAYLAVWVENAPMSQLLQAWTLAQPLSDLHQAISYQHILAGLEPAAQIHFRDAVPHYLRKVLRALKASTA
jgi:aminoglycoside/choline kinase family phosphotransferase